MPRRAGTRRRTAGRRVLGAVLLLLLVLVTCELVLRHAAQRAPPLLASTAAGHLVPSPERPLLVPFDVTAEPGVPRIVYVGASTEAGYPYGPRASPASWTERVLRARGADVEVIAVAGPGMTSAETRALFPDLLALHPSAIVLGVGHNEYLRSGRLLEPHWWNRFELGRRLSTFCGSPPPSERQPTPEHDFDHAQVLADFRENLRAMQAVADEAGVPLFVTIPVCNLLDFPPLLGDDPRLPESPDAAWQRGRAALDAGDVAGARAALERARDTDRWPFRTRGPLVAAIEELSPRVVRTDLAFEAASARGVPGFDLFVDNCHPNLAGLRVLASAVADALQAAGIVATPGGASAAPGFAPGIAELSQAAGLTPADEAAARELVARGFVGFAIMTGRDGQLAQVARRLLDEALPAAAAPGEMERSYALLALLAGDVAGGRRHLAAAEAQAQGTLATLERACGYFPWMAAVFARNGLAIRGGRLVETDARQP